MVLLKEKEKTRKNLLNEHLRKFLADEMLEKFKNNVTQTIELGDLGYGLGLEGKLEAVAPKKAGTHDSYIIVTKFYVWPSKKPESEEKEVYTIYLKYPASNTEHVHGNWLYNEAIEDDNITIVPLSGGNGKPKIHAWSECAGESLQEKLAEFDENVIIVAHMFGARPEAIKKALRETTEEKVVEEFFARFAKPNKPTEHTITDTQVNFPDGYLAIDEKKRAFELLKKYLNLDVNYDEEGLKKIKKATKNYSGKDADMMRSYISQLEITLNKDNTEYEVYEYAFQKGINRLLTETKSRLEKIRVNYEDLEDTFLKTKGGLTTDPANKGLVDIIDKLICEIKKDKEAVGTVECDFVKIKTKYENVFDPLLPTVSCPVDLLDINNIRICKQLQSDKKIKAQGYLIDQWLPPGKGFADLRGSPAISYYMLKQVAGPERNEYIQKFLQTVCRALEIEFIGKKDENGNYIEEPLTTLWKEQNSAIDEIIKKWFYIKNERSIADRKKFGYLETLNNLLDSYGKPVTEQLPSDIPLATRYSIYYRTLDGQEKCEQLSHIDIDIGTLQKDVNDKIPRGSTIEKIEVYADNLVIGKYQRMSGKLQKVEVERGDS